MATDEKMTIDEVFKYPRLQQKRYRAVGRAEKGVMLDEMERMTGRHRKTLERLLAGDLQRKPRQRQRGRTYQSDLDRVVRLVWESYDHICAERLHPNLLRLAEQLEAHGELELTLGLKAQLGQIGLTTLTTRLQHFRQDSPQLPRRPAGPRNLALADVPMRRLAWDEKVPGHCEVDLVWHSGPDARGDFGYTLQLIDIATGWSERVAILGRSYRVMQAAFERILARIPFEILSIHPDNGSEFFNAHLRAFWQQYPLIQLSRSRPYQKNDNRFVEEKNSSLVRHYIGDIRLDTSAQILALNAIYDKLWLYNNAFQPSLRVIKKTYRPATDAQPARLKRRYSALTPWERLCATDRLSPEQRQLLQLRIDITNPRRLRQEIYDALSALFAMPGAPPGQTQNVFETLTQSGES